MKWKLAALSFGAGALAVTVGVASAAGLGVLDVNSLGTSSEVIAGCDETIAVSWGGLTYTGSSTVANSTFTTNQLILSNVDANCDGHHYAFVVADSTGAALASGSGTLSLSGGSQTFTFTAKNSKTIEQVTVTIFE